MEGYNAKHTVQFDAKIAENNGIMEKCGEKIWMVGRKPLSLQR